MKAGEKSLVKYLDGNDQEFIIPVFQRRYDWRTEQCKRLWEDLLQVIDNNYKTHFFGSIVSVVTTSPKLTEYLIIDGQQRITTISLIMAAICNLVKDGKLSDDKGLVEKIYNEYLIDPYQQGDSKFRLKLITQDREVYNRIIDMDMDGIPEDSNVRINYDYFVGQILKNQNKYSVDQLFGAIRSLFIVDIQLTQGEDDPQLIFESLNSTGLALSEADKIRNLVLMNLPIKQQTEYYSKYWQKIEANTSIDKNSVSDYVRDFLTMKLRRIPRADRVYFEFKDYSQSGEIELGNLLCEMLKYSRYYHMILTAEHTHPGIQKALKMLLTLDNRVTFPYLLELFDDFDNEVFAADQMLLVLRFMESFLFRRTICSVPTNALNKYFASLEKDIRRYPEWKTKYAEVLFYIASKRHSSSRYPSDEEFLQELVTRDIYHMQARNKVYLLEELENYDEREIVDVSSLLKNGELTIEHIMPQTLTTIWENTLGNDFLAIHMELLHTLGNLTLSAYNSTYSNRPFLEKKEMPKGFRESKLTLNKYVQTCDNWGKTQIEARAQMLANAAIKRWQEYQSSYQPAASEMSTYSLEDEESHRFQVLGSYEFQGIDVKGITWSGMYKNLFTSLCEKDPSILAAFAGASDKKASLLAISVVNHPNTLRTAIQIGHNIYVETNLNTDRKLQVLRELFDLYEIDHEDLTFNVQPENDEYGPDEDLINANMNRGISVQMWEEMLVNSHIFQPINLAHIKEINKEELAKISAGELAKRFGMKPIALTSQVSSIGRRIIKHTGIEPQYHKNGNQRYWNIMFTGDYDADLFIWAIRPELKDAMERVDIDWSKDLDTFVPTANNQLKSEFWADFNEYAFSKPDFSAVFTKKEKPPQDWYYLSVGSSAYFIALTISVFKKRIGVELYFSKDKNLYRLFQQSCKKIEEEVGIPIGWSEGSVGSRMYVVLDDAMLSNKSNWHQLFDWYCDMATRFKLVGERYGKIT